MVRQQLVPYVPKTAMKNKKTTTPTQGGPFALLPYVWRSMVRHQFGLRGSSALYTKNNFVLNIVFFVISVSALAANLFI